MCILGQGLGLGRGTGIRETTTLLRLGMGLLRGVMGHLSSLATGTDTIREDMAIRATTTIKDRMARIRIMEVLPKETISKNSIRSEGAGMAVGAAIHGSTLQPVQRASQAEHY